MGGIVGRLFREFAVTLSVAILVSLLVSLTATPMMCARLLRHEPEKKRGSFSRTSERAFDLLLHGYERSLTWALQHGRLMMVILIGTVCLNIYLYTIVPKGFFPQQDTGRLTGNIQADQSIVPGDAAETSVSWRLSVKIWRWMPWATEVPTSLGFHVRHANRSKNASYRWMGHRRLRGKLVHSAGCSFRPRRFTWADGRATQCQYRAAGQNYLDDPQC
jgi:multidrug efflux pump subunit AcrB